MLSTCFGPRGERREVYCLVDLLVHEMSGGKCNA